MVQRVESEARWVAEQRREPSLERSDGLRPLLRLVLLGAGFVVIAAGLRLAASQVNMVLVSMLIATTIFPIPLALTKRGLSKQAAVLLTVLGVVVGGVALLFLLAASLRRLSDNMPVYQDAFAGLVARVNATLAARGIDTTDTLSPAPQRIIALAAGLVRGALGALGYGLLTLILVTFFLFSMPLLGPKDAPRDSRQDHLDGVTASVRSFVGISGILGGVQAIGVLLAMLIVGTDAPAVWTVLTFLLAFVPFGGLIASIPPTLLTLLEGGVARAAVVFGTFVVVNIVSDNILKPKFMGSGLGLSPLVIILALMLWSLILGPMGALLAVPLTIALMKMAPLILEER
jgi:predicted PurR-regulated permease PerM